MKMLKPAQVAKVLGTNAQSVRIRMQKGSFIPSIGTACALHGNKYTYEIFPDKLAAYLNITVDELRKRIEGSV